MYKYPMLFEVLIAFWHGVDVYRGRYKRLAEIIGKDKSVLEPACGTAPLARYLDESCTYRGFDTNKEFLRYAQEECSKCNLKNFSVYNADARNPKAFEIADVIAHVDSLHHHGPRYQKPVLRNSIDFAQEKIIILDPHEDVLRGKWYYKSQFFRPFTEALYDYTEKDGHNQVRIKNMPTKAQLVKRMENGYGLKELQDAVLEIETIGEDVIATYYL